MDFTVGNTSLCLVLGAGARNTSLSDVSKCWDCQKEFGYSEELFNNVTISANCTECLQDVCSDFVTKKNWYRAQAMLPVVALMGILMLLGIPGNTIVLVVYYFKDKKTTANKFMMALASIDLHACLVIHPYIIAKLFKLYSPNIVVCKIFEYLLYVSQGSQGLTLIAVAVDRCLAVMKPLAFGYADKAAYMIPACLGIGAAASIPIILFYGQKTVWLYDQQKEAYIRTHVCHYSDEYDGSRDQLIFVIATLITMVLTVMVISVLYTLIAVKLRRRNAQIGPLGIELMKLDAGRTNTKMQNQVVKISNQSMETTRHLNEQAEDAGLEKRVRQSVTFPQHDLIARAKDIDLITALEDEPIANCSSFAPPASLTALEDEPTAHSSSSAPPIRMTAFEDEPVAHCSSSAPPTVATFKVSLSTQPINVPPNEGLKVHGTNVVNKMNTNPAGFKGCKLLFIVTMVFFVSWLPFWVLRFMENADSAWQDVHLIKDLLSHLFFLNNAVNPILYAFINKKFREECKLTKKKISIRLRYLCC